MKALEDERPDGGPFYVTTPIYYINDKPHIGSAYTTIVADTIARWRRQHNDDVLFVTGTDEFAQKTVDAAKKRGKEIKAYTDEMAATFEAAWEKLGISNTDFIRTTEERHINVVRDVWNRLEAAGDLYKDQYEGLYCKGHEAFMREDELVDGLCPDHKVAPELVSETNYYFRLSKYEKPLLEFYETNPEFVSPLNRFNEVRSFVERGLEDMSFSREKKANLPGGESWGIEVPNDPSQVIYVWIDALVNYISAIGIDGWEDHPADVHAVGKDILRFHALVWPAMLMSAGLPLPEKVIANGYLTANGTKMGKSLGNVVDPFDLIERYGGASGNTDAGVDALRYFLLREIPYGQDGDFSEEKMKERYNGDLANGLGNFAARVLTLAEKEETLEAEGKTHPRETLKKDKITDDFRATIDTMNRTVRQKMNDLKFHDALAAIWEAISFGDRYVNDKKVWEIKDNYDRTEALSDLVLLLEAVAFALAPFLPATSRKISAAIEHDGAELKAKKIDVLFPRIK